MVKLLHNSVKSLKIKKPWLLLTLGLTTTILILLTAAGKEPVIFTGDFETRDFSGWKQDFCCEHSGEIVSSPTRGGNYAAKLTLNRDDPVVKKGKRVELKRYGAGRTGSKDLYGFSVLGSENWYGFSIYLPNDWVEDTAPDIVTQWHDRPDFWFGENWKRPSLSISIDGKNWSIGNVWDPKLVTKDSNIAGQERLWSGAIKKGAWTDWVFHVKWSHKSDGLIEIWKDGKLIVNKRGPSTYNDLLVPYLKIGSYKYTWKSNKPPSIVNQRVIYFDELRIGDASASYEDVVPRF